MSRATEMLSTAQVAAQLGVTPWWVRRLIRDGELRAVNYGGPATGARWRVDPQDLTAFIRSRQNRARDLFA